MKIPTVHLFNVPLALSSIDTTVHIMDEAISSGSQIRHSLVNAQKLIMMNKKPELKKRLHETHILHAEGKALFWASKLYNKRLPENFTNKELMSKLIESARKKDYNIYFLGSNDVSLKRLIRLCETEYHKDIIAGYSYHKDNSKLDSDMALEIHLSGANILFLDLEESARTRFLEENRHVLSELNVIMGEHGDLEKTYKKLSGEEHYGSFTYKSFKSSIIQRIKNYLRVNLEFIRLLMHDIFFKNTRLTHT